MSLDVWRLHDRLTIRQAALLACGRDPAAPDSDFSDWHIKNMPSHYYAVREAILQAILENDELGEILYDDRDGDVIYHTSWVRVSVLKSWFWSKGLRDGFFFPAGAAPRDYLDSSHPRYAPHLAAAIRAWEASEDWSQEGGKTPKQFLARWLRQHAQGYNLDNEEGGINETAVERIAQVANWDPKGGAPSTPSLTAVKSIEQDQPLIRIEPPAPPLSGYSKQDFDLDDDIPF